MAYLRRFISNLARKCQPFSRLMKKGVPFEWDQASPIPGKPLILYVAAQERSVGALLAQENSGSIENSLYYLSRMMTPNELKYSPIEKLCLALVFPIQKLKHYFQAHVIHHPIPDDWELIDELPDEDAMVIEVQPPWKMYFDGAANREGAGASVVFVTSQGEVLPYSFSLTQHCNNSVAEYQALILGLEMAVDMRQLQLHIFGDSKLVINQFLGSYEVKKQELCPYHDQKLIGWLGNVTLQHLPRKEKKKADALAALALTLTLPGQTQITICQKWIVPLNENEDEESKLEHLVAVTEAEKVDWRQTMIDYLCYGILPENPRRKTEIREDEATQVMQEAYSRVCGSHQSGLKLHFHIKRMDVVGPLPKSSEGYLYILVATDYFSKWAEVVALKEVKKENVANFIRVNIIYRFGIPNYIITDNGKLFENKLMTKICKLFGFKQRNSSMYYDIANGLAEAFNKTLCNLLKKVVSKSKRDWHDRMEEALWAYRTTHRTPTQTTLYSLVYGVGAVLPLERQIPSLRLAVQEGLTEEKNTRLRLEELESFD
ncbi:PREDICTED: uncharacterized protein LOC109230224 [Nicotiana attenuata]|uniref:uncharacterized protein LOC109230224 n=1 Tax=Nicotiana attenuata TaxID=49451 RepID=UPI0009057D60|nr:PREDICTED: uncharacterized protein LOC109230224 [Nicotiana attenuata]